MEKRETAREVAEFLKHTAETVGQGFVAPDDDWSHIGFVLDTKGEGAFLAIDGSVMDPRNKDRALADLGLIILRQKPKIIAFVLNTRQVIVGPVPDTMSRAEMLREAVRRRQVLPENLKDEPTATEALVVTANSRSDSICWLAEIKRDAKNPPTLGAWKEMPDRESRFDDMTRRVFTLMDRLKGLPPKEVDRALDRIISEGRLATVLIERKHGPQH